MPAPLGNQFAVGNRGGSPKKFSSASDLKEIGTRYIEETLKAEKHLTFTGLCLALKMCKETFNEYMSGKYDDEREVFSDPLKELKLYCENYAESRLFGNNPTGAIFALKNYGWKDNQSIEITGADGGPIEVSNINALNYDDLLQLESILAKTQIQGEVVDITPTED